MNDEPGPLPYPSSFQTLHQNGLKRVAVALGVFDGVHMGHQQILHRLKHVAAETDAVPVAATFSPHPRSLLSGQDVQLLCSERKRCELLRAYGAEAVVVLPFTEALSVCSPEQFLQETLLNSGLTLTALVAGENWRFGSDASGGGEFLKGFAPSHCFLWLPVPEVAENKQIVSSSRIRCAVTEGDLDEAQTLLNRPYSLRGVIGNGFGVATVELETPTANMIPESPVLPPYGVYAAFAQWRGTLYKAVVNIGLSPTFDYGLMEPRIEVHLIGEDVSLSGETLEIFFIRFLREEVAFSTPDELKMQISEDLREALGTLEEIELAQRG